MTTNYLYHVTTPTVAEYINEHGLRPGIRFEDVESIEDVDLHAQQRRKLQKTRVVDTLLDEHRPETMSTTIPTREGAIYTWTTEQKAHEYAKDTQVVLTLDATEIPGDGGFARTGDLNTLSEALFEGLFQPDPVFANVLTESDSGETIIDWDNIPPVLTEYLTAFWERTQKYSGQSLPGYEAWFQSHIPADAVVSIDDPDPSDTRPSGSTSITDIENHDVIASNITRVFDKHKPPHLNTVGIDDVFVIGSYATGTAIPDVSPLTVCVVTDTTFDRTGHVATIPDETRRALNTISTVLELLSHQLLNGVTTIPTVNVDVVDTRNHAFQNAVEYGVNDPMPEHITYSLTTNTWYTPPDITPDTDMESLHQLIAAQVFPDTRDPEELHTVVNDFATTHFEATL